MEPASTLTERLDESLRTLELDAAGSHASCGGLRSRLASVRDALNMLVIAMLRCLVAMLDRAGDPEWIRTTTCAAVPGAAPAGVAMSHGHEGASSGDGDATARKARYAEEFSRVPRAVRADLVRAVKPCEERACRNAHSGASWGEPRLEALRAAGRVAAWLGPFRGPLGIKTGCGAVQYSCALFVDRA